MFKEKDRVRATSGENVIVGRVSWKGSSQCDITVPNGDVLRLTINDWDITTLSEPVNAVDGMIIVYTEQDGKPSAIYRDGWYWITVGTSDAPAVKLVSDVDTYGKFEVVYDPTSKVNNDSGN